jgi:zinc-binding alcohol dehydrogenase family protein
MSATTTAFGYTDNLPIADPAALTAREVPVPELGLHDLLVEVRAVSVNPVDVKQRLRVPSGGFRVLGFDAAGLVREVGPAVTEFAPGDEVYYAGSIDRPGTNQLLHIVDERIVGFKPSRLSFADAAALPLTALTAWESAFDRLEIKASSEGTFLVVGASGGVGSILVQLLHALAPAVRVIGTASTPETARWVKHLGAHATVNHAEALEAQILDLAPDGVDWLFTSHSAGQIEMYARVVQPFGHIVAIDDGPADVSPLKPKSIAWHWEFMFTQALHRPESTRQREILNHVANLVDAGVVSTTTQTILRPFDATTLREGHRLVETGHVMGKVVIAAE